MTGIIYLLRNEAMPGLVKIGRTEGDLAQRIRALNNTSVPFDFECFYAARVRDCIEAEGLLHAVFADRRVNPRREFFLVDEEQAKAALRLAALEDVTPTTADVIPDDTERQAVERMAGRRRRTSLADIGLTDGAVLTLTHDPRVTCTVVGASEVEFCDERLSLSAAALKALRALGYEWTTVNGWAYWCFEGRVLRDLVDDHLAR